MEVLPSEGTGASLIAASGTLAERPLEGEEKIARAFAALAREAGVAAPGVQLRASSTIPVARGLGSSGSATVAGLVAANEILGRKFTNTDLFRIGCALEGHPDNVGPALVGGCTLAMPDAGGSVVWYSARVHPDLRAAVAWPVTRVETARARKALPEMVKFTIARDQARRLAQLLEGLATADRKYLQIGILDELHTPFRAPLIPGCAAVMDAAMAAGADAVAISGSGSAIIALGNVNYCNMQQISAAMAAAFSSAGERATHFESEIPRSGAAVARIEEFS